MSKYERLLIYPLLFLALAYGFFGNPAMQASQETAVFNRIEASEIVIKNDDGVEVIKLRPLTEGGGVSTYSKSGSLGTMVTAMPEGGYIATYSKKGGYPQTTIASDLSGGRFELENGVHMVGGDRDGQITIYNKDGKQGISLGAGEEGGFLNTFYNNGVPSCMLRTGSISSNISIINKTGEIGVMASSGDHGGNIFTNNEHGDRRISLGFTDDRHGAILVYDRYGEFPGIYGHRR